MVTSRRGFPRRQEDPLIQQLLQRAREEYAQSSAIGSPSMYKAAAGGGFGPVATVLAAQILGGVRSSTAQRQAREIADRQQKSLSTAADLSNLGYTDTSQGRVFVDNDGRLMRVGDIPGQENNIGDLTSDVLKNAKYKINENQMEEVNKFIEESQGPLNEIARIANQEQSPEIIGQEDDISIIEPETTQSSVDPNIPKIPPIGLEPTTVIEGEKPSMLSRVLTGAGDTTKTYRTLGDYITDAGYDRMEYNLFQDQLKQNTSPKFTQIKLGDKLFQVELDSKGQVIPGSENEVLDAEQKYIKPETYKVTLKNGDIVEVDGRTKTGGKLELNINGVYQDASNLIKNEDIKSFERSKPEGTKIVSTTNINQKAQNKLIGENIAPLREQHFETISNENKKKALQAINQTSQLLDLFSRTSEQGGDLTGTGAEFINVLRGVAKTLGAEVDEKALTSIQNMGAITREKVIPLAKQLGVNPTDFDFKNLIETAPKAANTPAANMYLIRVLAYYANQQADKIAYLQSLNVRKKDGKLTLTFSTEEGAIEYSQKVEAYYNKLKKEDEIFFKKLAADPFGFNP